MTFFSLSGCNCRGVNSTLHCHYTMASADSKFDDFFQCIQFESTHSVLVNYRNLPVLVTNNELEISNAAKPRAVLRFLVHCCQ